MAKKKYYESKKDRRDESVGMKKELRKKFEETGMIRSDYNAVANLPQNVVQKDWPKPYYGQDSYLDDSISGIDNQMFDDAAGMRRQKKNEKY